jgi:hypothetical protein
MANKALAKRQKLSFRVEPSQKAPRGQAASRWPQLQPQQARRAAPQPAQPGQRVKDKDDAQ